MDIPAELGAILVDVEYRFIYDCKKDAPLCLIVPGAGRTTVHHQYNCVSCHKFEEPSCALYYCIGPAAAWLEDVITSCSPITDLVQDMVHKVFGRDWSIQDCSEGLAKVLGPERLIYLATNNCE